VENWALELFLASLFTLVAVFLFSRRRDGVPERDRMKVDDHARKLMEDARAQGVLDDRLTREIAATILESDDPDQAIIRIRRNRQIADL
jgi:hypothetical protein